MNNSRFSLNNFPSLNIDGAASNPAPELDFILPGMLAGSVGSIVGTGGVGKSYLSLALGMHITAQVPIFDSWAAPKAGGRVVMLAAEDSTMVMQHRMHYFAESLRHHNSRAEYDRIIGAMHDQFAIYDLTKNVPKIVNAKGVVSEQAQDLLFEAADNARLIIIDPLRQFHLADENDSSAMSALIAAFKHVAANTECTILFTHHVGKSAILNGNGGAAQASRGSSALTDDVRWQLNVAGMIEAEAKVFGVDDDDRSQFVSIHVSKVNYGRQQQKIWLERQEGGVLARANLRSKQSGATRRNPPQKAGKPVSLDDLMSMQAGGEA